MSTSFYINNSFIRILGFIVISLVTIANIYAQNIDADVEHEINFSKKALKLNKLILATQYASSSYSLALHENDITLAVASNYYAYILNLDSTVDKAEVYEHYFNAYLLMINLENIEKYDWQKISIESILGIANIYYDKGLKLKALNIYKKLPRNYSLSMDTSYALNMQRIINCYFYSKDYVSVIGFSKAMISDSINIEKNYINISNAYSKKSEYLKAISNESVLLRMLVVDDSCKALYSMKRIAKWYYKLNDNAKAIDIYEEILRDYNNCPKDELLEVKLKLATSYSFVFDYRKSENLISEITKDVIIKNASNTSIKAINQFILLAYYQNNYKLSLERLEMYFNDFDKIKYIPLRIQLYTSAITIYESVGDYKSAYRISKILKNLNSIVLLNKNAELELLIKKQRSENRFSNKIFENGIKTELYRRDAETKRIYGLKEKVVLRNRVLLDGYLVMFGFIFIVVLILIFGVKYHFERKKLNIDLQKSNEDLAYALKRSIERKRTLKELNKALIESNNTVNSNNETLERKTQEINIKNNELAKALEQIHEMQDQLIESQRLASLGQVTAGIAHEIRNPLNFVLNFSALIIDFLKEAEGVISNELKLPESEGKKNLDELLVIVVENANKIIKHGNRASKIITDMLNVSRKGSNMYEHTDINSLIKNSAELAIEGEKAGITGFNVDVEYKFDETECDVSVIPQDFGRVIINLIGNACQAIEPKIKHKLGFLGKIEISTKCNNKSIFISIKDNGIGIPEEVKEKIFTPFFTTKPAGKGTGLGLTMTYDIITKLHKGNVNVDSKVGEFTIINIEIPTNLG